MTIKENIPLKLHSHYKIGGPTNYFAAAKNEREVKAAVKEAKKLKSPIFVLGGGTNLLISDLGFRGFVLKPEIRNMSAKGNMIRAGAGVLMKDLLEFAAKKKLSGLEWAGGLPGTVGGAVRGNAGCFGGETKDAIHAVKSLDVKTLKSKTRNKKECRFGYRTSVFKEKNNKEIILEAVFRLSPGNEKEIRRAIGEKIAYRAERHPIDYPNIGSIFKNVPVESVKPGVRKKLNHVVKQDPFPVVPVAYLIANLGLQGIHAGGAMISPKHPNFIVNSSYADARDVENLIALIKDRVKRAFGIDLEEEVMKL